MTAKERRRELLHSELRLIICTHCDAKTGAACEGTKRGEPHPARVTDTAASWRRDLPAILDRFRPREAPQKGPQEPSKAGGDRAAAVTAQGRRERAYSLKAMQDELAKLADAKEGGRNNQLYASAFKLGRFVASGALSSTATATALLQTALDIGLPDGEARTTIRSAFDDAREQPATMPPARGEPPARGSSSRPAASAKASPAAPADGSPAQAVPPALTGLLVVTGFRKNGSFIFGTTVKAAELEPKLTETLAIDASCVRVDVRCDDGSGWRFTRKGDRWEAPTRVVFPSPTAPAEKAPAATSDTSTAPAGDTSSPSAAAPSGAPFKYCSACHTSIVADAKRRTDGMLWYCGKCKDLTGDELSSAICEDCGNFPGDVHQGGCEGFPGFVRGARAPAESDTSASAAADTSTGSPDNEYRCFCGAGPGEPHTSGCDDFGDLVPTVAAQRATVEAVEKIPPTAAPPPPTAAPPPPPTAVPPPSDRWELYIGSDVEMARVLRQRLQGGGPPVVYDGRHLRRYDRRRGIWEAIEREALEVLVHDFDGYSINDRRLRLSQQRVISTISASYAQARVRGFFDAARPGLAFSNGFVEIDREGAFLRPHSPEHRALVAFDCAYDEKADAREWHKFLRDIFRDDPDAEEKRRALRQFIGASLLGIAPRFQQALVLLGGGANGKSVLIEVARALFPAGATTAIPPQDFGQEYRRAHLAGKLLNAVSELPEADIIDSESFKAIIAGDIITGRHLRDEVFEFRPIAGHIFAANALPATKDQTVGFWRRLLVVIFNRTFLPHEQDPELSRRLIRNELAGIARWAIDGAVEMLASAGYTIPGSAREALKTWQRGSDQVRQFEEELLERADEPSTAGSLLYEEYRKWASRNGHHALSSNKFAARLEGLGFRRERTERGSFWTCNLRSAVSAGLSAA